MCPRNAPKITFVLLPNFLCNLWNLAHQQAHLLFESVITSQYRPPNMKMRTSTVFSSLGHNEKAHLSSICTSIWENNWYQLKLFRLRPLCGTDIDPLSIHFNAKNALWFFRGINFILSNQKPPNKRNDRLHFGIFKHHFFGLFMWFTGDTGCQFSSYKLTKHLFKGRRVSCAWYKEIVFMVKH